MSKLSVQEEKDRMRVIGEAHFHARRRGVTMVVWSDGWKHGRIYFFGPISGPLPRDAKDPRLEYITF